MRIKLWHFILFGLLIAVGTHAIEQLNYPLPFGIHETADDASYYRPAYNFLEGKGWRDNSIGASSYVGRPPLMGFLYLINKLLFGSSALFFFYFLAIALHGCAIYHLKKIADNYFSSFSAQFIVALYCLLPCFWGFLSYGITEAFSSSLVIIACSYCLLSNGKKQLLILLNFGAILVLFRPVLVLILFPLLLFNLIKIKYQTKQKTSRISLFSSFVLVLIFSLWQMRIYTKTGQLSLHPIYHQTNHSEFRPPHAELTNLFRVWEHLPENFHFWVGKCRNKESINLEEVSAYCRENGAPISPQKLLIYFQRLQNCYVEIEQLHKRKALIFYTKNEIQLVADLRKETAQLKSDNSLRYYLLTPIHSVKHLFSKSQLNLTVFQEKWRGSFPMECLRYFCLLILLASNLSLVISLFNSKSEIRLLAIGVLLFLFYLFYVQRLNEDRYLVPILGINLLFLAFQLDKIKK